jgi:hypothetical protein
LRSEPQTLTTSALGSFADLGLFEGQAGGSPRERLIDLYHGYVAPFLENSKDTADKIWVRCNDTASAALAGAATHLIEIGAATDFVREVLAQVSDGHLEPRKIHAHAALAFVVIVGRAVKSAPWSRAVATADADPTYENEVYEDDHRA